jgi:transposase
MTLSMDLRDKVMKAIRGGLSCRQAAGRFDIGPATAVPSQILTMDATSV